MNWSVVKTTDNTVSRKWKKARRALVARLEADSACRARQRARPDLRLRSVPRSLRLVRLGAQESVQIRVGFLGPSIGANSSTPDRSH